jgi:hypothetical protein
MTGIRAAAGANCAIMHSAGRAAGRARRSTPRSTAVAACWSSCSPRAEQLGHSRVSMTQDGYLGRRSRESRVAAALEGVDPMASGESVGESVGPETGTTT